MMADDVRCPNLHDGMAAVDVQGNSGHLILVRNHEGGSGGPYVEKPSITYADDGGSATTNMVVCEHSDAGVTFAITGPWGSGPL